MERESLLALLTMSFGGLLLQLCAAWPSTDDRRRTPQALERRYWFRLWYPVIPTFVVVLWLIGWALREPDPVPGPVDPGVVVALSVPFVTMFLRAGLRALWALMRRPPQTAVSTVGLIQPQVIFAPFLAKQLDDDVVRAALLHEQAHVRHRDPLRIWLAQLVTDLQWPWPQAPRRLERWLEALELARDDEARVQGADGSGLANAILASLRYRNEAESAGPLPAAWGNVRWSVQAPLTGEARVLRERIARLLAPLPSNVGHSPRSAPRWYRVAWLVIPLVACVIACGAEYGEQVLRPLLGLTS
ncbi:MAG: hypothetical protein KGL36_08300 [Gammaproteobacteria bacterium]|nr:hypothetical protein [Gammaproteobacteria bacterium]